MSVALDADCLVGLSVDELRALANFKLSTAEQAHLDDLIARNTESQLSSDELAELLEFRLNNLKPLCSEHSRLWNQKQSTNHQSLAG